MYILERILIICDSEPELRSIALPLKQGKSCETSTVTRHRRPSHNPRTQPLYHLLSVHRYGFSLSRSGNPTEPKINAVLALIGRFLLRSAPRPKCFRFPRSLLFGCSYSVVAAYSCLALRFLFKLANPIRERHLFVTAVIALYCLLCRLNC